MAEAIRFVHGDTLPQLKLTINDTVLGTAVDLSSYTVFMYIRAAGTTQIPQRRLSSAVGGAITKAADQSLIGGSRGECVIAWGTDDLKLATGSYEAEIELVHNNGSRETIYDLLTFYVRGEVGPTPLSNDVVIPYP